MSNPLVDRILGNPLTFVAAKAPEKEAASEKHPSYIVLGSDTRASHHDEGTLLKPKKPVQKKVQPKSMADAIAAYTGRKYLTKKERKKLPKKAESEDEGEEVGTEQDASGAVGNGSNDKASSFELATASDAGSGSDSDSDADSGSGSGSESHYESASEFQTDSSFQGFRTSSDDDIRSETVDTDTAKAELETSSDEERVKADSAVASASDESDDESYDDNAAVEDEEEEDDESDELGSASEAEDASDAEKEYEAEEEEDETAEKDTSEATEPRQTREDLQQLRRDLLADAKKTTPPSSPEPHSAKAPESAAKPAVSTGSQPQDHYNITETAPDHGQNGSKRITKNWTKKFQGKHPVGLLNFGVTCYMNSAIQSMAHIPAVQHYLLEVLEGKHPQLPAKSVTHTLAELSSRMWGFSAGHGKGPRKFVNPKKIIQRLFDINCMMSEWQQEDSHEYFMSLMSRLQEDSTPKGRKLNESIIYDIFGGLLQQEVTCKECNTVSTTKQEFYDLSLGLNKKRRSSETEEIPCGRYSIQKSITDYFSLETIRKDKADESSGYYCEKCKARTVATKKSTIERSPETLMVHLKRFKFNGSSSSKVKQAIIYPGFLDLTPYTITEESTKYRLISVIVHEGRSISSGHYICHCLQPDGSWSTYDDEYINKTDEMKAMSDPSAYCLIYTRLTPKEEEKSGKKRKNERGGQGGKKAKH